MEQYNTNLNDIINLVQANLRQFGLDNIDIQAYTTPNTEQSEVKADKKLTLKTFKFNDIRRKTLRAGDICTLDQLQQIVNEVYESDHEMALQYEDEEGDFITLGNDADLRECLAYIEHGGLLKIRVQCRQRRFMGNRCRRAGFGGFFGGKFHRLHQLHLKGMAFLNRGEHEAALNVFLEQHRLSPLDSISIYNAACAASLAGKLEDACEYLAKAVSLGYKKLDFIKNDDDLDNIRNEAMYLDVIRRLEAEVMPKEVGLVNILPVVVPETDAKEDISDPEPEEVNEPISEPVSIASEPVYEPVSIVYEPEPESESEPELDTEMIETLTAMGFSEERAKLALLQTGNVNTAIELLLGFN